MAAAAASPAADDSPPGGDSPAAQFEVRVTAVDWSMQKPSHLVDRTHSAVAVSSGGAPLPIGMVPVVRVFGATPAGQRCCVHVHQAFPYCYAPYIDEWPDPGDDGDPAAVRRLVQTIAAELDELLGSTAPPRQQPPPPKPGAGAAAARGGSWGRRTNVVDVEVVKAMPYCALPPSHSSASVIPRAAC